MSALPTSWSLRQLGDVAETALGKMLDRGRSRGLAEVPYLRNVNVQWGRIDTDDVLTMELADQDRRRFGLEPGDLLVCEGGEIGRAAIWRGQREYMAYQKALHRVRPSPAVDVKYLLHLFKHMALSGQLAANSTGTTIPHLPQQRLRRLIIPVPPIDEQRRIVDIIEDHLSRLDASNAALSDASVRTRTLVASVLHTGTRGADIVRLGELALSAGYGTSTKCVVDGPGPAVARIPNIVDGRINMSDEKRVADPGVDVGNYMLREGDLLIVRTNGSRDLIGRSAVVQSGVHAAFASYLIRYELDTSRVSPAWVNAVLASPALRFKLEELAASSAGQYNLSLGKLDALEIPVPSLADQVRTLAVLDAQLVALGRLGDEIARAGARQQRLRRALLHAAFSGQLTGSSSDLDRAQEMIKR